MENIITKTLIDTLECTQSLANWYLKLLDGQDPHKIFECNGVQLNTFYWTVGHMAWAEEDLILHGTHGLKSDFTFLQDFSISKSGNENTSIPFEDLLAAQKAVHQLALNHLANMKDSDLEKENAYKLGFQYAPSYRTIIMHHIRHLGVHIGHLSWLCKLYGVKTV